MLHLIFLLLSVLFSSGLSSSAAAKELGRIKFSKRIHDFGRVPRGEVLVHRFKFKNIGSGVLSIHGVHAPCGCTAVELEEGKSYQPGEEGAVEVRLDTSDFEGQLIKAVTVMTNERSHPDRILTLKAFVETQIKVDPPLVDFGEVSQGQGEARVVTLTPLRKLNLQLDKVRYNEDTLSVSHEKSGAGYVINVTLKDDVAPGFVKETMVVVTSSSHLKELRIPVRATVHGRISKSPSYLEFGAISPGEKSARTIAFKSEDVFEIKGKRTELHVNGRSIEDGDSYVALKIGDYKEQGRAVVVELLNLGNVAGSVHGRMFIKTSDEKQSEITVDFYAFFR